MRLDDRFDQVQAESRAMRLILHRAAAPKERVEYPLLLIGGDAGAVVRHPHFHRRPR